MHIICPHCHSPIELLAPPAPDEVLCPSCGSSFRLERGTTTSGGPGPGRRLGRFELLTVVGSGAFGTVYRARDPNLDREVAVKVPRAGNLADGQDLDRFLREARSVAQLRHPSIVPVHEVGQEDGVPFLVSDFVEGVTLADLLTARRPGFREAAELVAACAEALQYAHQCGVVHRDVKPSNIMLDSDGRPHLMDFGLAKREAGEITMTLDGQVLGTPAYMSPEQARGEAHRADGRSDVYSLGAVLYQLLTGELPFRGNQRMLLHQVLHDEPRPPRQLNDRIPRDLETVCLKAMAKEPGRRYQTAGELAADLHRFLAGEPVVARPVGGVERAWRWARRHPAAAALLAVSGLAVLALAVGGVSGYYSTRLRAALEEASRQRDLAEQAKGQAEDARREKEVLLYFMTIERAHSAWRENNVKRADDILEACNPEERKTWEWRYLHQLCNAELLTFRGHTRLVRRVAFSPDGARLASASPDEPVKVWDAKTGQEALSLKGRSCVAWSPDGTRLASASADEKVKVWDAKTGQEVMTLEVPIGGVHGVAWSHDGSRLASAYGGGWGTERQPFYGGVKVWDAKTGQEALTLEGHTNSVRDVVWSRDGSRLAGASADGTVKVWDAKTGQEVLALKARAGCVAFSPDGMHLASAGAGEVKVWDAKTGQEALSLKGHTGYVCGVTFSPDGIRLATASADRTAKVWDARTGEAALTLKGHTDSVNGVAFSPDGSCLASASEDGTVKVWDATSEQDALTLTGHMGPVWGMAWSPDGTRLASASEDQTVKVWDAGSGQVALTLKGHTGMVFGVAWSPDGGRLASASEDGTVKLWDARTGQKLLSLKGHRGRVWAVAFSPQSSRLASASEDGTVKVWDAKTGQEALSLSVTLHHHTTAPVYRVAWSPDGSHLASGSEDDLTVKIWDTKTGQEEALSLDGYTNLVRGVAVSPDGSRQARNSGQQGNTVMVWDTKTRQEVLTLNGHTGLVLDVAWSPDGSRLASSSQDKTVKLWPARPLPPAHP